MTKIISLLVILIVGGLAAWWLTPKPLVNYGYKVVNKIPHDRGAFTQGLLFHEGFFYESTGGYGTSSVRKVQLEGGVVRLRWDLDASLFGEGLTLWDNQLVQITWRSRKGFVYDLDGLKLAREFTYNSEGWGLTTNGVDLFMSDGSDKIYVLNPMTFTNRRNLEVHDSKGPIKNLNELEYIEGKIWANIWQTDDLVIINPQNGRVEGRLSLKGLRSTQDTYGGEDVLNGIAYDADEKRIFVTGKRWAYIYQIELERKSP
ncbi:MAG: glutaminyl-peptide cyclotransferase [Acidobacteria bacterium]|nr:glutaminyl-peptide cyclotransferase [Acidobacteriota bacterium]